MLRHIMPLVPPGGRPYVEPYCGGANLLFARAPAPEEVISDLDERVVGLFVHLQQRSLFRRLETMLSWTPMSRDEFGMAIMHLRREATTLQSTWAFYVMLNQGFGGFESQSKDNWGRYLSEGAVGRWLGRLMRLVAIHWRLQGVKVERREALDAIATYDNDDAVVYLDPPYVMATRANGTTYRYDVDERHHKRLVDVILKCRGAVVLSGYDHPIYAPLRDAGWRQHVFRTACHAAPRIRGSRLRGRGGATMHAPRTECVWQNPKGAALCAAGVGDLPLGE